MKAKFSPYLTQLAPKMRELVDLLGKDYDYVSILSTDSVGFSLHISQRSKSVTNENMTTERGNVVRVCRDGLYSEYAFNTLDDSAEACAQAIRAALDRQLALLALTGTQKYETGVLTDEPCTLFVEKEAEILPEEADMGKLVETFSALVLFPLSA